MRPVALLSWLFWCFSGCRELDIGAAAKATSKSFLIGSNNSRINLVFFQMGSLVPSGPLVGWEVGLLLLGVND